MIGSECCLVNEKAATFGSSRLHDKRLGATRTLQRKYRLMAAGIQLLDVSRLHGVPVWLRNEMRWVLWRFLDRRKLPWSVFDTPAKTNDPETWHDHETCVVQYRSGYHAGVGFVLGHGFCGLDLDGCRCPKSGELDSWALPWLSRFQGADAYSEVSPSGTGVKVFFRSRRTFSGVKQKLDLPQKYGKAPGIELYSAGRFFCVTAVACGGASHE